MDPVEATEGPETKGGESSRVSHLGLEQEGSAKNTHGVKISIEVLY